VRAGTVATPNPIGRATILVPGLVLTTVCVAVVAALRPFLPAYFGDALVAVLSGLLLGNLVGTPNAARPGVSWMSRTGLRLAIVLMGARLAFGDVLLGGAAALVLLLFTMSAAGLAVTLVGRRMALPRRLTTLLAVGTAVCGNSAIIATAPIIQADEREVSLAVATITVFGTIAVFVFPLVGHALGLPPWLYGVWAGAAVNDTSQVLAAGAAYGDAAVAVATIVKLTRNTLMAPILFLIGFAVTRRQGDIGLRRAVGRSIPPFVVGFMAVALLNSIGALPAPVVSAFTGASRLLILGSLVAIGWSTRVADVRMVGIQPFLVGLAASIVLAGTTLGAVVLSSSVWRRVFGSL